MWHLKETSVCTECVKINCYKSQQQQQNFPLHRNKSTQTASPSLLVKQSLECADEFQVGSRRHIVVTFKLQSKSFWEQACRGVEVLAHRDTPSPLILRHFNLLQKPRGHSLKSILRPRLKHNGYFGWRSWLVSDLHDLSHLVSHKRSSQGPHTDHQITSESLIHSSGHSTVTLHRERAGAKWSWKNQEHRNLRQKPWQ